MIDDTYPPAGGLDAVGGQFPWQEPPRDSWDRADGDWGDGVPRSRAVWEERAHANSCYRLGSRALGAGHLPAAGGWLGTAKKAGHPGGWFRAGALVCRLGDRVFGGHGPDAYLRYLVEHAAQRGHGDALRMRPLLMDPGAVLDPIADWEDPLYGPEVLFVLRHGLTSKAVVPVPEPTTPYGRRRWWTRRHA
ncbi:hypothetical protein NJL88_29410 [Streptomyces sp. DK15]|uniref:hypothetical protein n=1 Tax=Streptomyces sp. DK15 TaxID=2957499 RepID=UPI0029B5F3E1|nr:hypothetical protein [Streptomyces sp. DK15]MDX2394106.1 hypothetical protein [Streptomyces sp. DK15]